MMLGVVEMVARQSVLIDGNPVHGCAQHIPPAHEADQIVVGVVVAHGAARFAAGADREIALAEIGQGNFLRMGAVLAGPAD